MRGVFFIFLFSIFQLHNSKLFSQGCSDAGVCSVGSMNLMLFKLESLPADVTKLPKVYIEDEDFNREEAKSDSLFRDKKGAASNSKKVDSLASNELPRNKYYYLYPKCSFQFTSSYGLGDQSTSISITQLEATIKLIDQKLFAQAKLPFSFISGKLANTYGLGDITLSLSYIALSKKNGNLSLTGGVKIPTNKANITKDGLPLPMVYQTSLGTTDALIGAKYIYKKWELSLGYQHAFNQNGNQYVRQYSVSNILYNNYADSRNLKRSDDAVFRINRNFIVKKTNLSSGLLFIYHLANDRFSDGNGKTLPIPGSQGLTLNFTLSGMVKISKKIDLTYIFANPFITRKSRPDGLTRKFVAIIGLKYNIY